MDGAGAGGAVPFHSGRVDDEGDLCAFVEERTGLGPFAFFAELIAVIDGEDDDGVVAESEAVEFGDDAPDVPVAPGDGGDVGADDFLGFGFAGGAADEEVGVAFADGGIGKAGRHGGPGGEIGCEFDLVNIVHVEEFLRGAGWAVRFDEAAAEEEGLILVLVEDFDGVVGGFVIGMAFALAVENDDAVGVRRLGKIAGKRGKGARREWRGGSPVFLQHHRMAAGATRSLGDAAADGPGFKIIEAAVINFADADGGVTIFLEELREGGPVGVDGAEVGAISQDAGDGRAATGHERGAGGIAEGKLAIVVFKADAGFGECVEVGGFGAEHGGEAAEFGTHVVGHKEKNVGFSIGGGRRGDRGRDGGGLGVNHLWQGDSKRCGGELAKEGATCVWGHHDFSCRNILPRGKRKVAP